MDSFIHKNEDGSNGRFYPRLLAKVKLTRFLAQAGAEESKDLCFGDPAAFWRLDTWTNAIWAAITLAGLLGLALAVPHSRRVITRRFWCVLARHRLQRLCYEARLHTRSGRLPLILWTRPTNVGERIWIFAGVRSLANILRITP